MVTKHPFAVFGADQQIQRSIHDFAFSLQARKFSRPPDQVLIYVDVGAAHELIIHQYQKSWCMRFELPPIELLPPDAPRAGFARGLFLLPPFRRVPGSLYYGEEVLLVRITVEK